MGFFDVVNGQTTGDQSLWNQYADGLTGKQDADIILFSKLTPPAAPTATVNTSAGNLTGNYQYAIAFVTGYWQGPQGSGTFYPKGNTGGGTASATISPSAQQVNLNAIPTGPTGVYQRIIYRTKANGSSFFYLATLNDNTSTTYTDNIADSSLGAAMPTTNSTGGKLVGDGSNLTNVQRAITFSNSAPSNPNNDDLWVNTTNNPNVWSRYDTASTSWIQIGSTPPVSSVNGKTGAVVLGASDVGAIPTSAEGAENGVATLDDTGNVPASQLKNAPNPSAATSTSLGTVEVVETPASGVPVTPTRCASFQETLISGTSAQTVLTYTPQANHNFELNLYFRVVTATTNLTITVTYTDAGGAETYNVLNAQACSVGQYSCVPFSFNALKTGAITVSITAGTANQVYASGALKAV